MIVYRVYIFFLVIVKPVTYGLSNENLRILNDLGYVN